MQIVIWKSFVAMEDRRSHLLSVIPVGFCVLALFLKLWLITRININWDEFAFLSRVHELANGLFLASA